MTMDVFPDFGGLDGIGELREVIGALLTFVLIIAVLMLIVLRHHLGAGHRERPPQRGDQSTHRSLDRPRCRGVGRRWSGLDELATRPRLHSLTPQRSKAQAG